MYKFSTSMMCADPFALSESIGIIDKHTDYYHIDIMDGHFVPNLALSFDYIRYLKDHSTKPIDVHLMVTDPLQYVDELIEIGVQNISFHLNTVKGSAFRLIQKIKTAGIKVGLVINPAESIEEHLLLLAKIDRITIMTVEPGFAGQKLIPEVLPKIKQARELKLKNGYTYEIEIDGSNNLTTFKTYIENGAEVFILGSGLFKYNNLDQGFKEIKAFINGTEQNQPKAPCVIGMDIGGTFTRIGIVDPQHNTYEVRKISTDLLVADFSKFVIDYFNEFKEKYHIVAISMGYPGIVNSETLEIVSVPNKRELEGKDDLKKIAETIKLPLYIDKDTNALFVYDIHSLNLSHNPSILGFYVGTGFGNAIKIENKLVRGDNGSAGEIGHIPVRGVTDVCGCGNIGCVETLTSGVKLKKIHQTFFADTPFEKLFTLHQNSAQLIEFIRDMANTIATEIILFDVSKIILGGGVIAMSDFPRQTLENQITSLLRNEKSKKSFEAFYATSKVENGIIGAAEIAFQNQEQN